MRIISITFLFMICVLSLSEGANAQINMAKQMANEKETKVVFETTLGNIVVKLYNETPKHRDNFLKVVNDSVYNGVLFHRVIKDFMIQTGDPRPLKQVSNLALATSAIPWKQNLCIHSISTKKVRLPLHALATL